MKVPLESKWLVTINDLFFIKISLLKNLFQSHLTHALLALIQAHGLRLLISSLHKIIKIFSLSLHGFYWPIYGLLHEVGLQDDRDVIIMCAGCSLIDGQVL